MKSEQEIAAMTTSEYKNFHESFMQNNHGSSAPHVFFCIFFTVQCSVYASLRLRTCKNYQHLYEYLIIVLPLILAHTLLSDYIYFLNIVIMVMLLLEFYQHYPKDKVHKKPSHPKSKKIYSISIMRGLTYIITVFAILAVDFRDFPRHLAKTERIGFSLMDTGVGLFVLMSGLVHKNLQDHRFIDIIKGNAKFLSVLVILGIARYVSVKQLEYQEHVSEYGVHWNFFFTLAVCKLLATVILYFDNNKLYYNFVLQFVHEVILYLGIQKWVYSNGPRDSFISANREGIFSCLGYVCLYLTGAQVKNVLTSPSKPKKLNILKFEINCNETQINLIIASISRWILLYITNRMNPISRTLANASYCVFLEAILLTVVTMLYFIENVLQDKKFTLREPKIIESVNKNGLSYFLIANLFTGAINLSMRTLLVSSIGTFCILNLYMIFTLLISVLLNRVSIKI